MGKKEVGEYTAKFGLIFLSGEALRWDPARLRELHPPESRRRGEEFDTYASAFLGIVSEIDDPAFLLILREGVCDEEKGPYVQILVYAEQRSMSVDDDCLAGAAKPAAQLIFARQHHPNAHEDSRTAPFVFVDGRGHGTSMVSQVSWAVNLALAFRFFEDN